MTLKQKQKKTLQTKTLFYKGLHLLSLYSFILEIDYETNTAADS